MITGGEYSKDARRERIVRVAQGWLGTPYHPGGRVKGAGVDCLTLLAEVYCEAGIVPHVDVPYYPHDWHLHRGAERYLDGLLKYAKEIAIDDAASAISESVMPTKAGISNSNLQIPACAGMTANNTSAAAVKAGGPRMGDIALWKFGRCYSHGAIVVEWPLIIHAYVGRACVMENVECAGWLGTMGDGLTPRPVKFFDAVGE